MSDQQDAAQTGAQAAQANDDASTQVISADAAQTESSWDRTRKRVAEGATSVSAVVGDKVSDLRRTMRTDPTDPTPAPGEGQGLTPAAADGRPAITRRTRKARLRLSRLDPWSVMKTVFLFSIAGAIVLFVSTWVVWGVINASGIFDSINTAVNDLAASPSSESTFRLEAYVNTSRILGFTAVVSAINVVLITALATLFSFLYNLAATVMGGLEITLAED